MLAVANICAPINLCTPINLVMKLFWLVHGECCWSALPQQRNADASQLRAPATRLSLRFGTPGRRGARSAILIHSGTPCGRYWIATNGEIRPLVSKLSGSKNISGCHRGITLLFYAIISFWG